MALTYEERMELLASKATLVKAMRSGARDVTHGDKRVSYRTLEEMQTALDGINEELAEADTGRKRKRTIYIDARRGY